MQVSELTLQGLWLFCHTSSDQMSPYLSSWYWNEIHASHSTSPVCVLSAVIQKEFEFGRDVR